MAIASDILRHRNLIGQLSYKLTKHKEDSEDLTSQVIVKAIKKIDSYNPKYALSTWLHRITINQHLNNKRREKPLESTDSENFVSPSEGSKEDQILFKVILEKELRRLDKEDREIYDLYVAGHTIQHISKEMLCSPRTVHRSIQTTMERLKKMLS